MYNNYILIKGAKMYNPFLDREKALETIVYLSQTTQDVFHLMKVIYYAEKLHLEKYGQSIYGDFFMKMEDGPVPSGAYDIVKCVRDGSCPYDSKIEELKPNEALQMADHYKILPKRKPRLEYLSESNMECLNEAVNNYGQMDFNSLWQIVHQEKPYIESELNKPISSEKLIKSLPNGNDIYRYLID